MTFVEFLSYADFSDLFAVIVSRPLTALKYTGVFGLLILLTGVVGALLVRAAFKGARVHPWRAFLTLAGISLAFGWVGTYWGYVGVLQTLESVSLRPTAAQLGAGAVQAWTLIVLGTGMAALLTAAGALVAKRRGATLQLAQHAAK